MSFLLFVQFLTQVWVYKQLMVLPISPDASLCLPLLWREFVLTCLRSVTLHVALLASSVQLLIDWGHSPSLISFQVPSLVPHTMNPSPVASGLATHLYFPYLIPFLHCLSHPWALKDFKILIPLCAMVWPRVLSLTKCICFPMLKN